MCTKITEVNASIFCLQTVTWSFHFPHQDLMSSESWWAKWKLHETVCGQNIDKLTSVVFVRKAHYWALYHMLFQNKFELYKENV